MQNKAVPGLIALTIVAILVGGGILIAFIASSSQETVAQATPGKSVRPPSATRPPADPEDTPTASKNRRTKAEEFETDPPEKKKDVQLDEDEPIIPAKKKPIKTDDDAGDTLPKLTVPKTLPVAESRPAVDVPRPAAPTRKQDPPKPTLPPPSDEEGKPSPMKPSTTEPMPPASGKTPDTPPAAAPVGAPANKPTGQASAVPSGQPGLLPAPGAGGAAGTPAAPAGGAPGSGPAPGSPTPPPLPPPPVGGPGGVAGPDWNKRYGQNSGIPGVPPVQLKLDPDQLVSVFDRLEQGGGADPRNKVVMLTGKAGPLVKAKDGKGYLGFLADDKNDPKTCKVRCYYDPNFAGEFDNVQIGDEVVVIGRCAGKQSGAISMDLCRLLPKKENPGQKR